jgi:predicted metal-dependent HD superfamily phosphohydrolase
MNYTAILEAVQLEVTQFFGDHARPGFVYHNLDHTLSVVMHASEIAAHYQCAEREFFIVCCAAWFHDTGYYIQDGSDHERRGADKAEAFLKTRDLDADTIGSVRGCILATTIPQAPHSLLEEIVCDADLYHLGTGDFDDLNKRMRKETEWRMNKKISKHEWRQGSIRLFEMHHYHTDYCRGLLEGRKAENFEKLKQKEAPDAISDSVVPDAAGRKITGVRPAGDSGKSEKTERPNRGIETMFRISSNNHQRLSDMADNKSHIMITTTSIIISVLLSLLLRKLEDNTYLTIPTILLLLVCVITMVFSILATRPTLPNGLFTPQDIKEKKVNLLFFGNFYRMKYEEFKEGMQEVMNDREFLYGSLTQDLYSQGIVLGRKYRLLRVAYNVFMYGIVASVFAYLIAVFFIGR